MPPHSGARSRRQSAGCRGVNKRGEVSEYGSGLAYRTIAFLTSAMRAEGSARSDAAPTADAPGFSAAGRSSVNRSNCIGSSVSMGDPIPPSHATARARQSDRKSRLLSKCRRVVSSLSPLRDRVMTRPQKKSPATRAGLTDETADLWSAAGASALDDGSTGSARRSVRVSPCERRAPPLGKSRAGLVAAGRMARRPNRWGRGSYQSVPLPG